MKIGIIGAGQIGGTLTRRLSTLGHDVSVANSRGPETLAGLAAETGATAVPVSEAARNAEVVVVTIPVKNVPDLPPGLLDGAAKDVVCRPPAEARPAGRYPRTCRPAGRRRRQGSQSRRGAASRPARI